MTTLTNLEKNYTNTGSENHPAEDGCLSLYLYTFGIFFFFFGKMIVFLLTHDLQ